MELGDYQGAPLSKTLQFIQSVELLGTGQGGMHNRLLMVVVQGLVKAHPLFIHSVILRWVSAF
jgi:hypothetical protein